MGNKLLALARQLSASISYTRIIRELFAVVYADFGRFLDILVYYSLLCKRRNVW